LGVLKRLTRDFQPGALGILDDPAAVAYGAACIKKPMALNIHIEYCAA
jgi:hypothetical protein